MNKNILLSLELLRAAGRAPPGSVRGCSEGQIAQLESAVGLQLPASYLDFLRLMGVQAGAFFVGTDYKYDRLVGMNEELREIAANDGVVVPTNVFAFSTNQGYEFLCFRVSGAADPEVYRYTEKRMDAPVSLGKPFSAWLLDAVRSENQFAR